MRTNAARQTGPRSLPLTLSQPEPMASQPTTRTIPVMVSEAEYQRLRRARRNATPANEPIDRKLMELLDGCD